jgi:hypothetical protein
MHDASRETLTRDLAALLNAGRDHLDMLVIRPRHTSNGLIIMVEANRLLLVYPQAGWLDVGLVWRFWRCGYKNKLSPRFERWGRELVHLVTLGSDPSHAAERIDEFFASVFNTSGPFALDFTRQGWAPNESVPPN